MLKNKNRGKQEDSAASDNELDTDYIKNLDVVKMLYEQPVESKYDYWMF